MPELFTDQEFALAERCVRRLHKVVQEDLCLHPPTEGPRMDREYVRGLEAAVGVLRCAAQVEQRDSEWIPLLAECEAEFRASQVK